MRVLTAGSHSRVSCRGLWVVLGVTLERNRKVSHKKIESINLGNSPTLGSTNYITPDIYLDQAWRPPNLLRQLGPWFCLPPSLEINMFFS